MKPTDSPTPYGPNVRLRATFGPVAPFTDLVVEVREKASRTGWREIKRFNDEDPHGVDGAHAEAVACRVKLLEGEQP